MVEYGQYGPSTPQPHTLDRAKAGTGTKHFAEIKSNISLKNSIRKLQLKLEKVLSSCMPKRWQRKSNLTRRPPILELPSNVIQSSNVNNSNTILTKSGITSPIHQMSKGKETEFFAPGFMTGSSVKRILYESGHLENSHSHFGDKEFEDSFIQALYDNKTVLSDHSLQLCLDHYSEQSHEYKSAILESAGISPNGNHSLQSNNGTTTTFWSPASQPLIPPPSESDRKKSLVLDLDETLIHSSFHTVVPGADWVLSLDLGSPSGPDAVYICKRPGVDIFLSRLAEQYELILFTASLASYANAVIDMLDPEKKMIRHRLFRDSCVYLRGQYIKDLTMLGRPLADILIIDNSPISYMFQPHHALPISSWYSDRSDENLISLIEPLIRIKELAISLNRPLAYFTQIAKQVLNGTPAAVMQYSNIAIVKQWEEIISIIHSPKGQDNHKSIVKYSWVQDQPSSALLPTVTKSIDISYSSILSDSVSLNALTSVGLGDDSHPTNHPLTSTIEIASSMLSEIEPNLDISHDNTNNTLEDINNPTLLLPVSQHSDKFSESGSHSSFLLTSSSD